MARFDRKVERTKKEFQFKKEKLLKRIKIFLKEFYFKWVHLNFKTILVFIVDFLLVTLLIIPILMQHLDATVSFVVDMDFVTSLLIVLQDVFS